MNIKPLLDLIGDIEANGNYNAVFGNPNSRHDLSQYTLAEIQQRQYRHGRITGSSAHGKYQFLRKTLASLMDELGLAMTDYFTPEFQDEMAEALLVRRGLHRWYKGRMTDDAFMDSLSMEWASLPYRTGASYYDGDGMNHALITREKFSAVLNEVRTTSRRRRADVAISTKFLTDSVITNPSIPVHSCQDRVLYQQSEPQYDLCVERVQRALNKFDIIMGHGKIISVDGKFGPKTFEAVCEFQRMKSHKLIDGIIGPITWKDLEKYL